MTTMMTAAEVMTMPMEMTVKMKEEMVMVVVTVMLVVMKTVGKTETATTMMLQKGATTLRRTKTTIWIKTMTKATMAMETMGEMVMATEDTDMTRMAMLSPTKILQMETMMATRTQCYLSI